MEIQIPSPSVFLRSSPSLETAAATVSKKPAKPRGAVKKTVQQDAGVAKPKQSKSRNGCVTCKHKRLKCDETKPSCIQCQKRNVTCEGYNKKYKWRAFGETTFQPKSASKTRTKALSEQQWSPILESAFSSASHAFPTTSGAPSDTTESPTVASSSLQDHTLVPDFKPSRSPSRPELQSPSSAFDLTTSFSSAQDYGSSSVSFSSGSPRLVDLLLPGTDLNQAPDESELRPPMSPLPYQPGDTLLDGDLEEADEEIVRPSPTRRESAERARQPSPALSASSTTSRTSDITIRATPKLEMASSELLLMRFDRHTCGILSVKDGPTENPWRTLIWPLAKDSQALYHAIFSMTAFHGAYETPQLRVAGMTHMTHSIRKLAADIENMRLDAALATSLALALSEGWDEKTSTGIQHLRGAKIMVNNAMVKHRWNAQQGQLTPQDNVRLKFLCNTFVYLDVIARLTSNEEAQDLNFEDILATANPPHGDFLEVDPLMGCATTLFPLIGRVANLIQKVRKTEANSLAVVSQAMELKQQLLQWQTPNSFHFEQPEDPSSEVQHSIQTAEAYRVATLLYLHQAVPEIPADPAELIAKRILMLLASVPLSSRTLIVQIFPLFAASCEVTSQEDRTWVVERWASMIARLKIGNVDSCWKVVREVWQRRDEHEIEKARRLMQRYTSRGVSTGAMVDMPALLRRTPSETPFDQIETEYTIRGKLHWLGVMSDWNWEVFLG